jgi:hypothetical protein
MHAWILILVVSVGNGGGPAMQEFSDKAACESALETVGAEFHMYTLGDNHLPISMTGKCVPKSSSSK